MSFLSYFTHKQSSRNTIESMRKEQDADQSPCRTVVPVHSTEKASAFTFRKGSITIETALVLPIFFLAVLCLVYRIEFLAVQINVRAGLRSAGKELAKEAAILPIVPSERVAEKLIEAVGAERLNRSMIEGGSSGIKCDHSWIQSVSYTHLTLPTKA